MAMTRFTICPLLRAPAFLVVMHLVAAPDHTITFLIQPYPEAELIALQAQQSGPLASPTALNTMLKKIYPFSTAGIIVMYGGYITVTNLQGRVTFPVMQQQPEFLMVVTPYIKPIFMLGVTVHHWELVPGLPVQTYSVVRKQDSITKLYYWDVQKVDPPAKSIIPLKALVILSKPDYIVVPSGITLTNNDPNFVLPSLYAYHQLNRIAPALEALKIKSFFGPIKRIYKKYEELYWATQITTRPTAP
jgi:hypothetical protein